MAISLGGALELLDHRPGERVLRQEVDEELGGVRLAVLIQERLWVQSFAQSLVGIREQGPVRNWTGRAPWWC